MTNKKHVPEEGDSSVASIPEQLYIKNIKVRVTPEDVDDFIEKSRDFVNLSSEEFDELIGFLRRKVAEGAEDTEFYAQVYPVIAKLPPHQDVVPIIFEDTNEEIQEGDQVFVINMKASDWKIQLAEGKKVVISLGGMKYFDTQEAAYAFIGKHFCKPPDSMALLAGRDRLRELLSSLAEMERSTEVQ